MSVLEVYDFEGVIEPAVATVLGNIANQLKAITTRDDPQFQNYRPRVEVMYIHGAGEGRHVVVGAQVGEPLTYDYRRESCWRGQLKLDVVTDATVQAHAKYVAQVRAVMANIWTQLNEKLLTFHKLQFAKDGGCSPRWSPSTGLYQNTLLYETYLSMQANAWARLTDPNPLAA